MRYEVSDGIALITLDRPERLNAINSVMSRELPRVWRGFEADASAVVAIVTGTGDRAFCTGADLADLPEMITDDVGNATIESIRWTPLQNRVWKPVICALNGAVMGGGLHFVAECDVVLSAAHAEFSDPHVSVGLVSALETVVLARRAQIGTVLRLALGGRDEKITAQEALRAGIVDQVCAPPMLLPEAHALATRIARNSPTAMALTKRAIWGAKQAGLDEASTEAWRMIAAHRDTPDFDEGIRAFAEKRPPRWARYGA
ncbi:MAG: enoyl-CoA hydratase/isomerase family protein [Sphingomonas sp.]|uniref:enoyl-CoA hydratase/isomerase family protein n=1 Tax=Sphingomonas sp. TaxID=28214 RepID=UPI0035672B04